MVVFLTPLDQPALEIGLGLGEILEIEIFVKNIVDKQSVDKLVTLIEIYGTDHGLESISVNVFLDKTASVRTRDDVLVKSYLMGHVVERLARYDLGAQLREEALVAVRKLYV